MQKMTFAAAKPAVRVNTITEAYDQILRLELKVTRETTEVGKLKVLENGQIQLDARVTSATADGFVNLCKVLGIPEPFAAKIPVDLLLTNIQRLQKEHPGLPVTLLRRSDDVIANVVKGAYKEIPYTDFLAAFDGHDIKYVDVGEHLVTLAMTFQGLPVQFREEDPLYVGSFIYNSILRMVPMHMFSGLFRTQCSNSFVAPYLGKFRADYKLEAENRLLRFAEAIHCYDEKMVKQLQEGFAVFESRRMFEGEVAKVWRKLSTVVGQLDADTIMGLNPDIRKAIIEGDRAREIKNRTAKLRGESIRERVLSDLRYYDVLNAITASARDRHQDEKLKMEKLAGYFLGEVVLA